MTAIFVGSFDPFHDGHRSIIERALRLFSRVVVGVGANPQKQYMYTPDERVALIREALGDSIEVEAYEGLTIDFARRHGAHYIVKGVRNADDFVYEQQQARWNKEHGDIETVLLLAEPELEELSSTSIRKEIMG